MIRVLQPLYLGLFLPVRILMWMVGLSPDSLQVRAAERELVDAILKGEHHQFEQIVERYQHRIVTMIARQVKDQYIAEDLAQDVFIRAFKGLKSFKGDSQLITWLIRITMNVVSSYFTSRKFKEKKKSDSFDATKHDSTSDSISDHDEVASEMREALRAAVTELKPTFRDVLTLCAFEGKQYEEAAEILNIPVGTVRSRLNKARLLLRETLGIFDQIATSGGKKEVIS